MKGFAAPFQCALSKDKATGSPTHFLITRYPLDLSFYSLISDTFKKKKSYWSDERAADNVSASELFFSEKPIYKWWDYRCLAPYSHKDPSQWGTYDVQEYREAADWDSMKKIKIINHDKNFNNFLDSTVMMEFQTNPTKAWWKTYDLPYAVQRPRSTSDSIKFHMMCLKMVSLQLFA